MTTLLTEFTRLVRSGDVVGFQKLLSAHPDLKSHLDDPLFDFSSPAVRCAVQRKDLAMVDALLAAGANLNQRSQWEPGGFGVLDGADDQIAAQLIARGAIVDVHAAAHLGRLHRLRELLQADPASVNARGGDGGGPLHFARDLPTTNLLLEHGASVTLRDLDHGSTAAMWQVRQRDVLYRLIAAGSPVDIYMACVHGDRALAERALREDPDCLDAYISHERGDGKFAPDTGGNYYNWQIGQAARPIPTAIKFGHLDLARYLLGRARLADRVVALCFLGDTAGLATLLRQHPDVFSTLDQAAARALPDAVHFGDTPAVERMIQAGFPVTGRGISGGTALHSAAWQGKARLVTALLERGAPVNDRNNIHHSSPLEWACHGSFHADREGSRQADYVAIVRALLQAGADVSFMGDGFQKPEAGPPSSAVRAVLQDHIKLPPS